MIDVLKFILNISRISAFIDSIVRYATEHDREVFGNGEFCAPKSFVNHFAFGWFGPGLDHSPYSDHRRRTLQDPIVWTREKEEINAH